MGRMKDEDCDERFTMHQALSRKLQPFVHGHRVYLPSADDSGSIHCKTGLLSMEQFIPLTQCNSQAKLQTM